MFTSTGYTGNSIPALNWWPRHCILLLYFLRYRILNCYHKSSFITTNPQILRKLKVSKELHHADILQLLCFFAVFRCKDSDSLLRWCNTMLRGLKTVWDLTEWWLMGSTEFYLQLFLWCPNRPSAEYIQSAIQVLFTSAGMIKAPQIKLLNFWHLCTFLKEQRAILALFDPRDVTCATCDNFWLCVCVSVWMKCEVWPRSLAGDRGHPLGVTTLAWLRSDSRPVCTVSCQALHIDKAVLLLVKQSGGKFA